MGKRKIIDNHYPSSDFKRYSDDYHAFKHDLFLKKANEIAIDLPIQEDMLVNGQIKLNLTLKSSSNKGLLSAQVLDYGQKSVSLIYQQSLNTIALTTDKISPVKLYENYLLKSTLSHHHKRRP